MPKALFKPLLAAAVAVRPLAFVAIRIPMFPAKIEQQAPITKATAVVGCKLSAPFVRSPITRINTAKQRIKITIVRYCLRKKAIEPSCIAAISSLTLSVPASILLTLCIRVKAKISASIPVARPNAFQILIFFLLKILY